MVQVMQSDQSKSVQDQGLAGPLMVAPGTVAPALTLCEFLAVLELHNWHCNA